MATELKLVITLELDPSYNTVSISQQEYFSKTQIT
jgi:hypothetical protein